MPAPAVAAIFSAVLLGRRSGLPAGFVGRAVAAASGAVFLALPLGLRADLQFSAISMAAAGAFRRLEVDVAGGITLASSPAFRFVPSKFASLSALTVMLPPIVNDP